VLSAFMLMVAIGRLEPRAARRRLGRQPFFLFFVAPTMVRFSSVPPVPRRSCW
jgi:hypothetical protein